VTPSFNQGEFLGQTILSVLEQDYPNLEHIVVDGGSSDGSVEVIKRYSDRISWWISKPDKGQADAINKGLKKARGEIVAWLNSDDVYRPGAIKQAVDALAQNPEAGLVYSNLDSIDESGKTFHTISYRQFSLEDLFHFKIIGQPTVFMRRTILDQAGTLDTSYHLLFDHHLWLRMAQFAPVHFVPAVWAAARRHAAAKNVARAASFSAEAFRILEWAKEQPALATAIRSHPRKVRSGAFRLSGRYLSESGNPGAAIRAYWQAFLNWPPEALAQWRRILFVFLQLLRLDSLIAQPRVSALRGAILVTGLHRSGTTWVGRMLAAGGGVAYVGEPLNALHRPGVFAASINHWYTYIRPENERDFVAAFKKTLALDYGFIAELKSLRSLKDFLRMLRDSFAFVKGKLKGDRVLLKDPFALFSLEWFAHRLNCTVVVLMRHPAAFVSSLKRLGWQVDFTSLLEQPLLMRDWLEPFRDRMIEMQGRRDDLVGQASLLWRMATYVVSEIQRGHPEFLVVRHEDLSRQPLSEFETLYARLALNFSPRAKERIAGATARRNPAEGSLRAVYATNLDSAANVEIWKTRLEPSEVARIREITGDVASLYYSEEDWNL